MADIMKENECFQKDYDKIYAKGQWTKEDLENMKNYKKLIYYNMAINGMENGGGFPGSEYIDMNGTNSFRRGRNPMNGQYMSRDMGMNGSGLYYPQYMDGMNMSGRRYYDSEKEKAIHKLHHMMENEDNAEKKNALKMAVTVLEEQK